MVAYLDVCRFIPTAGGTGDWVVSSAVTGYQTPAQAGATNGSVYRYRAESGDLSQWEVGFGAYTTGSTTLARTTVLWNNLGTNAAVNFGTVPQVAAVLLAEDVTPLVTGQIPGTATNDAATSGNVGEMIETSSAVHNFTSTVTITIASPAVITYTGHPFKVGPVATAVVFTTTGALPTGITSGTTYYAFAVDANTFKIGTTAAGAVGGSYVNTSGTQSGTHTCNYQSSYVNNTAKDVACIALPAGDWDVEGQVVVLHGSTTSVTNRGASLSTTTNSESRQYGRCTREIFAAVVPNNFDFYTVQVLPTRFSTTGAATNVFLNFTSSFTVSTVAGSGWMRARRVR